MRSFAKLTITSCVCVCELLFSPLAKPCYIKRKWRGCLGCGVSPESGTSVPSKTFQTYMCELAVRSPRPTVFHPSGPPAGVSLSFPLCFSQQSCPPAEPTPTSAPPSDFKHAAFGVMVLCSVCWHRKPISLGVCVCVCVCVCLGFFFF